MHDRRGRRRCNGGSRRRPCAAWERLTRALEMADSPASQNGRPEASQRWPRAAVCWPAAALSRRTRSLWVLRRPAAPSGALSRADGFALATAMRYACPVPSKCAQQHTLARRLALSQGCRAHPIWSASSAQILSRMPARLLVAGFVAGQQSAYFSTVGAWIAVRAGDVVRRCVGAARVPVLEIYRPRVRASSPADILSGGVLDTGARVSPAKMASGEKRDIYVSR